METRHLEQALKEETQGYASVVTRLPLKLALIKRGQIAALEQFLAQEVNIVCRLRELGRKRALLSSQVAQEIGLPRDSTLLAISETLPSGPAQRLATQREQLLGVIERLKEGNERCDLLLRTSLDFVRHTMEVFGGILNPEDRLTDMLYGPGQAGAERSGSVLLNRTA